jgi:hypothetical protein
MTGGQVVMLANATTTDVTAFCKGTTSSGTATAGAATPIHQKEKLTFVLKADQTHIACDSASGTADIIVLKLE